MKLKITENTRNEALRRSNIVAIDEEEIIPSRVEIRESLSAQLNIPKEQIVVRKVDTSFGTTTKTIYAMAYDDEEMMKKTEEKYVITRNFGKAKEATDAPAESAPVETAPKEEKPKEEVAEKKEETTEEKPKEEVKVEEKKTDKAPKKEEAKTE
jgi:ribosomal protein S24E